MGMRCLRFLLLAGLLLSASLSIGCPAVLVGGAAGGGAVAYVRGELKTTEEVPLNRAWKAAQMAMSDLEFTITDKQKDAFDSRLHASGAGGKAIDLALKKISPTRTEIRIRVGLFGDESLSRQILEGIKRRF
jgi:hypothetical protein